MAEVDGVHRDLVLLSMADAHSLLLVFSFFLDAHGCELACELFVLAVLDGIVVVQCQQPHHLLEGDPSFCARVVPEAAVLEVGPFIVPGHESPGNDVADGPCLDLVVRPVFLDVIGKGLLDVGAIPAAEESFGKLTAFFRAFDLVKEVLEDLVSLWLKSLWRLLLLLVLVILLVGGARAAGGSSSAVWYFGYFEFH